MSYLFMKQRLQQKLGKFLKMLKIKLKGNLNFVNLSVCNQFLCVVVFLLNEMWMKAEDWKENLKQKNYYWFRIQLGTGC